MLNEMFLDNPGPCADAQRTARTSLSGGGGETGIYVFLSLA